MYRLVISRRRWRSLNMSEDKNDRCSEDDEAGLFRDWIPVFQQGRMVVCALWRVGSGEVGRTAIVAAVNAGFRTGDHTADDPWSLGLFT
jgi:hypothetical protein